MKSTEKTNAYKNERNFGWLIGGIILAVVLYRYLGKSGIGIYWVTTCLPFVFLAIFKPGGLTYPLSLWEKLGYYLGLVNTTILLSMLYFLLFLPLSLLFRITKRDLLSRKIDRSRQSYWQAGDRVYPSSLKNQF